MRTVTIEGTFKMTLKVNEGIEISSVMEDIEIVKTNWHKKGSHESFDIEDATITGHNVVDSR